MSYTTYVFKVHTTKSNTAWKINMQFELPPTTGFLMDWACVHEQLGQKILKFKTRKYMHPVIISSVKYVQ
jgi:hypothetical protein